MSYTRTTWIARVGTALNRFLKTNETSTEVELTNDPTGVTTAGTPFTVANMNKIEDGIYDNSVKLDTIEDGGTLQALSVESSPTFANYRTATLSTVDLNTIIDNGHYYVTAGGLNNPSSGYCALLVVGASDIKSQTLIEVDTNNHWHRIGRLIGDVGESWTAWRLIDQDLDTTASPTFASIDTGFGYAEAHPITYEFASVAVSGGIYIPPMAIGEIKLYHAWGNSGSLAIGIRTIAEGYGTYYIYANTGTMGRVIATTSTQTIANVTGHYSAVIIRVA